jgi:hypothetical protein
LAVAPAQRSGPAIESITAELVADNVTVMSRLAPGGEQFPCTSATWTMSQSPAHPMVSNVSARSIVTCCPHTDP